MENEEDEAAPSALHNSPPQLDSASGTVSPQSQDQDELETESEPVFPEPPHTLVDGEPEVAAGDVISGEQVSPVVGAEITDGVDEEVVKVGIGEEMECGEEQEREEAVVVKENREVDVTEEETQVDDVWEKEVTDFGMGAGLGGAGLFMVEDVDAGVVCEGEDMEIGASIDVGDMILGTDQGEDREVGDDHTHNMEVIDNENDTELGDVGEGGHSGNTDDEIGHDAQKVEEMEVADVGEDGHSANTADKIARDERVVEEMEAADAAEEVVEIEVAGAAEEVEEIEVAGAPEEVKETKVAGAAEEVEETEMAGAGEGVEETEMAGAEEEFEETEVVGTEEEFEQTEGAGAEEEFEETEMAGDAEEFEETEVVGAAYEVKETEVAGDVEEFEETEVSGDAEEFEVVGAAYEVKETEVAGDVEEFEETEVSGDAEEFEETEVAGDVEEFEETEVAGDADEVEETEVAGDVDEVEETEVAGDADEVEETVVAGDVDEVEETEVAGDADEVEETEVAGDAEEFEETEVAGDADEVEETEVVGDAKEFEETEVANAAEEIEVTDAAEEVEEREVVDDASEDEEAVVADASEEAAEEVKETGLGDVADYAEKDEVTEVADVAEETVMEDATKYGGKRKRGRIPMAEAKALKKKGEEDVCFVCYEGGELVVCDRRGCPKAYHPACVNRDDASFQGKGRWNCGWHRCSNCEKNAHYMCYTCTFSLCKACIKEAVILCVKGNKGFCEACMETVLMIEQKDQEDQEMPQVKSDDKSSWEYLFKDYWTDLKERLHLTADDITRAKNPWKGAHVRAGKQEPPDELYDANEDGGSGSDSSENAEASLPKKQKPKKRLKSRAKVTDAPRKATTSSAERTRDDAEWASNELLELVMHMRSGDKSVLSQFDVQALLLDYIKSNKLRDPRRKSQIICDQRLATLFGKQRVGHFEMLKLLESHFYVREDSQTDLQGSVVDTEAQLDADGTPDVGVKASKDKKRKRKNSRALQTNLDDYAAIDIHNITLIYLKRNLLEDLIEDTDNFHDKVVGTFVRIRIAGAQKQDMYRLVQVVGTNEAAEPYKVGKRMTHTMLEILNLDKIEVLSIDIISNQDFTEDECKRLRQSIKCGLINRLTVGDIQEKAMALQAVRVKDWLEAEIVRLNHLRDRASDLGKKKQLRECVEKVQLLKTPEERQRRLEEIPEIHADPNMDPNYESEEEEVETDDRKQENYLTPRGSAFGRKGTEPISPRMGSSASSDSWSGTRNYSSMNREFKRSMSNKGYFNKGDDAGSNGEIFNESAWHQGRDMETPLNSHEKPKTVSMVEAASRNIHSAALPSSFSGSVLDISAASLSTSVAQSTGQVDETEKNWYYRDPSGKVQGPFSIVQLRKWNKSGYFPAELRIWKGSENQDDSILLNDALDGKIQKEPQVPDSSFLKVQTMSSPHLSSYSGNPHGSILQQGNRDRGGGERSHLDQNRVSWNPHGTLASSGQSAGESWRHEPERSSLEDIAVPSVEIPKYSTGGLRSDYNRNESTNLPSPTPTQSIPGGTMERGYENKWSPTSFPAQFPGTNRLPGGNGLLRSAESAPASSGVMPLNFGGQSMRSFDGETNSYQTRSQFVAPSESHRARANANMLQAPNSSEASVSSGAGVNYQNLVQPAGAQGWVAGVVAKPESMPSGPVAGNERQAWGNVHAPSQKLEPNNMFPNSAQQPSYGRYGNAPSFNAGNPNAGFPASGFSGLPQPNNNMPPVATHQPNSAPVPPYAGHQPSNMPPVAAHQPSHQHPGAPNPSWAGPVPGNPNMGWRGPAPGNSNWGPSGQGQTAGNPNPGWAPQGQGPPPGNTNSGWSGPSQGPPRPVNGNPGWMAAAPGQGPLPSNNSNPGWNAPTGNSGIRGSEQSHNGDRFSSQANSGYGGSKPWNNNNRQSSSSFGNGGGGGGGGGPRQTVCRFHENGHCKKGSSCNYMHT